MSVRVSTTTELTCGQLDLTVGVLRDLLAGRDPNERVRLRTTSGDRPGEISTVTLTIIHEETS